MKRQERRVFREEYTGHGLFPWLQGLVPDTVKLTLPFWACRSAPDHGVVCVWESQLLVLRRASPFSDVWVCWSHLLCASKASGLLHMSTKYL